MDMGYRSSASPFACCCCSPLEIRVLIRCPVRVIARVLASVALVVSGIDDASTQEPQPLSRSNAIAMSAVIQTDAHVVSIDADSNSLVLQGPRGDLVEIEVNPDVGDVRRLNVGDMIHIIYKSPLLLSAEKVDAKGIRSRVETDVTTPASGGTSVTVRLVRVVATVQRIDPVKREVTLRGTDRTLSLGVAPDVPLDKLRVGDSIQAEYAVAAAVQVTRNGAPIR